MHVKPHAFDFHFEVEIFKLYLFDDVFKVYLEKDNLMQNNGTNTYVLLPLGALYIVQSTLNQH